MKRFLFTGKIFIAVVFMLAIGQSCTNLDEEVYSEITPENYFQTEEQFISALGNAYTQLYGYAMGDIHDMRELSSDEMVTPTRGADWDDGGHLRRLHQHSWNNEDPTLNGSWNFCFGGVSTANRLIATFQGLIDDGSVSQDVAGGYIAELKVLRAFFYLTLLDTFGKVPIVTGFADAPALPASNTKQEVYDFIEAELTTNASLLTQDVGGAAYGRANYWVAQMILAKLYLNAVSYTGNVQWTKAKTACEAIINSGKFELEGDYFTNFNVNNSGSKEFIFAIPYDKVYAQGFNLPMKSLHYGSQFTFNLSSQPWNGFCSMKEFYDSYADNDLRKGDAGTVDGPATRRGNFLAGYQYTAAGLPVLDDKYERQDPANPSRPYDEDGDWVNFDPDVATIGSLTLRQAGARVGKWQYEIGGTTEMSNDFSVFRLADVILMLAEANWRLSGSSTDAVALGLLNEVRDRAGLDPVSDLDAPISFKVEDGDVPGGEIFNERGREMFEEQSRRTDLIRWGMFTEVEKWKLPTTVTGDFTVTGAHTVLFPIPKSQTDVNPNLDQNDGY
ncbi:MAG TPA: RagB/SusD family nutrient uptake outer membrane protein [Cyclobacteriaceae bacterium]|nr:RagB/SusD family nutrient uptake outer membrane protein [Cyclobacteriaceae bacterium]